MYSNGNGKMTTTAEMTPPHDLESETAVLGSLLIDPDAIHEVRDILGPEMFYATANAWVYEAMVGLASTMQPIDVVTVTGQLRAAERLSEIGGEAYIINLMTSVPSSVSVRAYAETVEANATRRRMIQAAGKIAATAYQTGDDLEVQLDAAETAVFNLRGSRKGRDVMKPKRYVSDYLAEFERLNENEGNGVIGLPTGFTDVDRLLGGMQAPFQYVLAGRPGMGKSAMALDIIRHLILRHNKRVMLFSLEMSVKQIMARLISAHTRIDSGKIKKPWLLTDEQRQLVYQTAGELSERRLYIDTSESLSPSQLRAKAMRVYTEHGLDLVVVDHMHLMRGNDRAQRKDLEIGEISRELMALGKTLNAPILTLAQLSRGVESRQDKRPMLSDLRESGAIEENAYCAMFLYRDEYYNELSERPNTGELIIAKHRDGPTGTVDLYWNSNQISYRNLKREAIL